MSHGNQLSTTPPDFEVAYTRLRKQVIVRVLDELNDGASFYCLSIRSLNFTVNSTRDIPRSDPTGGLVSIREDSILYMPYTFRIEARTHGIYCTYDNICLHSP